MSLQIRFNNEKKNNKLNEKSNKILKKKLKDFIYT